MMSTIPVSEQITFRLTKQNAKVLNQVQKERGFHTRSETIRYIIGEWAVVMKGRQQPTVPVFDLFSEPEPIPPHILRAASSKRKRGRK